jgi:AcrR family transcriptional regulator
MTRPSLRQRKKDRTHHDIAEAAWALFLQRGYEQTSVNEIADRANVAPRTFFRYFPTKEAVLFPEIDEALDGVAQEFRRRPASEPIMVSLFESLDVLARALASRDAERMALVKASRNESIGDYFRERTTALVADLVRERERDHPDVELRARLASGIIGVMIDAASGHVATAEGDDLRDIGQRCVAELLDLMAIPRDAI